MCDRRNSVLIEFLGLVDVRRDPDGTWPVPDDHLRIISALGKAAHFALNRDWLPSAGTENKESRSARRSSLIRAACTVY